MDVVPSIASIGALVGSPARANILTILFDGRALTATELSHAANVGPATTSVHLGKLVAAGLLVCEKHGRHRYFRIAGHHVAEALEPMFHLVQDRPVPMRAHSPQTQALREARLCYDHIAGRIGVMLATAMVERGFLVPDDQNYIVTDDGEAFCLDLNIDLQEVRSKRRMFARQCLDWSERKPHLAGALGAAVTDVAFKRGWVKRTNRRRIVRVTDQGWSAFADLLHMEI